MKGGKIMYYYGGYSGYGNSCCPNYGYPVGGYGGGYGASIILVLFIYNSSFILFIQTKLIQLNFIYLYLYRIKSDVICKSLYLILFLQKNNKRYENRSQYRFCRDANLLQILLQTDLP